MLRICNAQGDVTGMTILPKINCCNAHKQLFSQGAAKQLLLDIQWPGDPTQKQLSDSMYFNENLPIVKHAPLACIANVFG